ncbi:COP9 signalosome (CSN) subunit [Paraconiothyrium brasiliense]|uniref:COP9 signalosome (CSN) subunit n=1 Tax=Paraconiothyrium brasiliense TaxID=300254 RepID=A0ABR3S7E9_9PLEO
MSMEAALAGFQQAYYKHDALELASCLKPTPVDRLYDFWRSTNEARVEHNVKHAVTYGLGGIERSEVQGWIDVFADFWRASDKIIKADQAHNQGRLSERHSVEVYEAWKDLVSTLQKYIGNGTLPHWIIFTLYFVANDLRKFAIKADTQLAKAKPVTFSAGFSDDVVATTPKNQKLEEAARVFSRVFALCMSDRNPNLSESRKWAVYCIANLQFKTYFKLKTITLCKNLIKSIEAQADMPPWNLYPKAHRVTYMYYCGVIAFLQEDYSKAETALFNAWAYCYKGSTKNRELILTYLIPCRLITKSEIPSAQILQEFPHLQNLFGDLVSSIKKGDLAGFDKAFAEGEPEFVRRRVFLTLERSRDIALRNLLRKVFRAAGYEDLKEGQTEKDRIRKTRIPLAHFATALRMGSGGGQTVDDEEVECLLANMIYKGLMKGYISREHAMVVLNKKGAFPGTGV